MNIWAWVLDKILPYEENEIFPDALIPFPEGFEKGTRVRLKTEFSNYPEYGKTGKVYSALVKNNVILLRVNFGDCHPFGGYTYNLNKLEKVPVNNKLRIFA